MSSLKSDTDSFNSDEEAEYLDPRIQIELERLNTCTDDINKLETELDEANTTFRMLLNESMRRLKVLTCKLGSCIDRARPYYEAVDIAKKAQAECQRAAVKFQRANEIHQAAKETVALAEARFLSNQHEWQFDSAWQEMLNHAIIKVTEAEHQRTESGQEHQKRATLFNVAEQRVAMLEQKLKRTIIKSRPYFEEKALCQEQLDTQKKRVEELQAMISKVKSDYSGSLKRLEAISEEIHQRRRNKSGSASPLPMGPREPGVGAELDPKQHEEIKPDFPPAISYSPDLKKSNPSCKWTGEDLESELDKFEVCSLGSLSVHTSSHVSESEDFDDEDLDELRQKVKELSMAEVRSDTWETELSESILRLDNAMLERECNRELRAIACKPQGSPLKEQACNRELTAIVSNKGEGTDDEDSETPASNTTTADRSEFMNSSANSFESTASSMDSKSLDTVLAEEETKREGKMGSKLSASSPVNIPRNSSESHHLSQIQQISLESSPLYQPLSSSPLQQNCLAVIPQNQILPIEPQKIPTPITQELQNSLVKHEDLIVLAQNKVSHGKHQGNQTVTESTQKQIPPVKALQQHATVLPHQQQVSHGNHQDPQTVSRLPQQHIPPADALQKQTTALPQQVSHMNHQNPQTAGRLPQQHIPPADALQKQTTALPQHVNHPNPQTSAMLPDQQKVPPEDALQLSTVMPHQQQISHVNHQQPHTASSLPQQIAPLDSHQLQTGTVLPQQTQTPPDPRQQAITLTPQKQSISPVNPRQLQESHQKICNSQQVSNSSMTKIEQLSAVALNKMVAEKEANLSQHNTPKKLIKSTQLINNNNLELDTKMISADPLRSDELIEVDLKNGFSHNSINPTTIGLNPLKSQKISITDSPLNLPTSNTLENKSLSKLESQNSITPYRSESNVTNQENPSRRQSIGATASKILNTAKIESLRVNLNENILHTIKDVSESVLNRLVRQDSKTESNQSLIQSTSILNVNYNPFSKSSDSTVDNNQSNNDETNLIKTNDENNGKQSNRTKMNVHTGQLNIHEQSQSDVSIEPNSNGESHLKSSLKISDSTN